jgi:hypothetical protein
MYLNGRRYDLGLKELLPLAAKLDTYALRRRSGNATEVPTRISPSPQTQVDATVSSVALRSNNKWARGTGRHARLARDAVHQARGG